MSRSVKSVPFVLALAVCLAWAGAVQARPADPGSSAARAARATGQSLSQAISDHAQSTTIAFAGLGLITGNVEAQSFFPPGKVADYFGFQYLRDNDPSDMGHNTSFLTRVACNVLKTLDATQTAQLSALALTQASETDQYGYDRYPFMQAFRRLVDGDLPAGTTGLSESAVVAASRDLYLIDGQMSYERAVAYADVIRSLSAEQRAYLDAMVGKGWSDWPAVDQTDPVVAARLKALPKGTNVAVMTYAGDIYSWYAGNLDADVYFCPERHGTYYGSFYRKDAPAMGVPGYSISEQLTGTAGSAVCDPAQGYVTAEQAAMINALLDRQRDNLYAGTRSIVQARTDVSTAFRSLLTATPSPATLDQLHTQVLDLSAEYGELDGENNYHYATAFAALNASLTADQRTKFADLRHSILSGTYADGTPFDFTTCTTPYLYSATITDATVLAPYLAKSDALFGAAPAPQAGFASSPAAPLTGAAVQFTDASTGDPYAWSWSFGDGATSTAQSPSHAYATPGSYTVVLQVTAAGGTSSFSSAVTVAPVVPAIAVTSPTAASSWPVGSSQTVRWTLRAAASYGEFRVGLLDSAGTAWLEKLVPVTNGTTAYTASLTAGVPAGTGYKAFVSWRPAAGAGAWLTTVTSAAFAVTSTVPTVTVTAPTAASSWAVGSSQAVSWTLSAAVPGGEFRVGLLNSAGTAYLDKQVLPGAGKTAYSTTLTANVPAGAGYKAYVYWRPTVGSGAWAATATSAAFAVTAPAPVITVTGPAVPVTWRVNSSQKIAWTIKQAIVGGEFRVGLVNSAGTAYLDKQVLPVSGKTSYSLSVVVSVPTGSGYKAYVYYRPTAGSGAWTATATSAAITVSR